MQQQELAIKQSEVQRKAQKDQIDAQLREQQLQIEAQRILAQQEMAKERLATEKQVDLLKTAAQMRESKDREIMKIGSDIAKQLSSQAHQKEISRGNR